MYSMLRPAVLVAGLAALAMAVPAAAETSSQSSTTASSATSPSTPPAGQTSAEVKEFTDEELKSFAAASLRVEAIGSKWQPKISGADDKAAEEELREQAMNEMVQAVEQKGLSVDRYNRIALAVQSDPEIARTVQNFRAERP